MSDSGSTLQTVLAVMVALLMLGLGSTVSVAKARRSVVDVKAPLVGLFCQALLMPFLGYIFSIIFQFDNVTAISVIAIGCTPGGSTSNLFSYFSRGDVSLSITMTVISSILSFGTLPLMLFLWGQPFTTDSIQIPYTNILLALLLVIVPVALGMTIRTYRPPIARYLELSATVIGVIFIVVAIIYGSLTEADIFLAPASEYVTCFAMVLGGAVAGYGLSIAAGLRRYQARTVAIETGIQNSTLTVAIMTFTFGSSDALLARGLRFPLLYSVAIIVSGVIQAGFFYWSSQHDSEEDVEHRLMAEAADRLATEAEDKLHTVPAPKGTDKDKDDEGAALTKGGSIQMADSTGPKLSADAVAGAAV